MSVVTTCVNGVCSCILPLDRNDYRPLALRHRSLAFVSALLIGVKALAILTIAITPTTAQLSTITSARIVQLTNAERQKAGETPLTVNPKLSAAAQRKAEDMLANDYFAHISPTGVTPWFWMQQQKYTYQVAGENLAIDFIEAEDVVAAWLASPSHRDNMLHASYTETGVAAVTGEFQGGTSTIVVHMFGLPTEAAAKEGLPTPTPATAGTQTKPTPTPTPLPTSAPDTTPPRTPRIAFVGGVEPVVAKTVRVAVEADADNTIVYLVNDAELAVAAASDSTVDLDVSQLPDGELIVRAQAKDATGNSSEISNTLRIEKDSTGPPLTPALAAFILSPTTDSPAVLATVSSPDATTLTIRQGDTAETHEVSGPIEIALTSGDMHVTIADRLGNTSESLPLALLPHYTVEMDNGFATPPARLNHVSRWLVGIVLLLLTILLLTAFFVRISIQRPAMLAHTTAVVVLACVLLFL